jgi:hypothetical protein
MLICSIALTTTIRGVLWMSEQGLALRLQHVWLAAPALGVLVLVMAVWMRAELGKLS